MIIFIHSLLMNGKGTNPVADEVVKDSPVLNWSGCTKKNLQFCKKLGGLIKPISMKRF